MSNAFRHASFFAGIGGFDLAFEKAGFETVFQSEINRFCISVLDQHWPLVSRHGDIATLSPKQIPDAEVWTGGFPCQDVSLANQGKRKGLAGQRSGLFHEFAQLIEAKKPEWVVLENVPGLLNSNQGRDFSTVVSKMDELGYGVSWRVLDAKFFGTPQRRRRVFIVCSRGTLRSAQVLFDDSPSSQVQRATGASEGRGAGRSRTGLGTSPVYAIQHATIGRKPSAGPQAKGFRNDDESYTLDSRGSADVVCATDAPFRIRKASGVPQGLDSNRYRALGNAVNVMVVEWIATRIYALLESTT